MGVGGGGYFAYTVHLETLILDIHSCQMECNLGCSEQKTHLNTISVIQVV